MIFPPELVDQSRGKESLHLLSWISTQLLVGWGRLDLLAVFDDQVSFRLRIFVIHLREGHLEQLVSDDYGLEHIIYVLNHLQVDLLKFVLQFV